MTPSAPVCIRNASTSSPSGVNVEGMSIDVSPVMHTALVARNNESTYSMPWYVHLGIISMNEPSNMKNMKLSDSMSEGLVRLPIIIIIP